MLSIETIMIKLRTLHPDQQQEVLDFIEFLQYKQEQFARRERFKRFQAFAHQNAALNTDLSEEAAAALIEEAREEVHQAKQQSLQHANQ